MFKPNLHILPAAQKKLWEELKHTPPEFVLYGGTALALRLAHRHSEDFDFFANNSFAPEALRKAIPYFSDGDLPNLSVGTQQKLRALAGEVNLRNIPLMKARPGLTGTEVQR